MKRKSSEYGQAILLLTAGIITLLGFAALAIDGGRLYSERRTIQGVSDTTAMTGALYLAHYDGTVGQTAINEAIQVALDRAASNGYSASEVTVSITEESGFFLVTATIDSDVEPVLAQVVYPGSFNVAAKSIARVENNNNPPPFALGQAFYSINKTACKAIDHSGNADVNIVGSGWYSNSTCSNAINIQGSAGATMTGDITSAGGIVIKGAASASANALVTNASQYTLPTLTEPDCTGLPVRTDGASTLYPGYYPGGLHFSGNGSWTLEPGFYCLDGDFQLNNGSLYGDAVSIYQHSGGFQINGGTNYLKAPQNGEAVDGAGVVWDGMVFFQAYNNTREFILNGNADSYYQGTFFVPDAHCRINGCGDGTGVDAQFVCDTIGFIGTTDINLIFDPTTKYVPPPPTTISLVE